MGMSPIKKTNSAWKSLQIKKIRRAEKVKGRRAFKWSAITTTTTTTELSISASHRVRKSLSWSIDSIPLSTGEDITCILCIKLILGQLSINYNELRRSPLLCVNLICSVRCAVCSLIAHTQENSNTSANLDKRRRSMASFMISIGVFNITKCNQ